MALFSRKKAPPRIIRQIEVPVGFEIPAKTRWGYTPQLLDNTLGSELSGRVLTGTELGPLVNLHHDDPEARISIRPMDDHSNSLDLAFDDFAGSFCSLALGLPEQGLRGLGRNDLLRLSIHSRSDAPFKAYVRLNLVYGPNSEQIVRMIDIGNGESFAEFDIFYSKFDPNRASDAWIDLIINEPSNRSFSLFDVVVLRRVRASL